MSDSDESVYSGLEEEEDTDSEEEEFEEAESGEEADSEEGQVLLYYYIKIL